MSETRVTGASSCKFGSGIAILVLSIAVPMPAAADLPQSHDPTARPIYAVRTRFSGTAGVVTFSTVKPPQARQDPPEAQAGTSAASPARLGSVLIPGMPRPRSGVSLTSRFGWRAAPLAGASRLHPGLDLAAPYGSAVVARSPGLVVAAGWAGGYGNRVVIDHGGGLETRYGHLSRIVVSVGQHVEPGTLLGAVGSTGLSTGPHLHYEVRLNGAAINPLVR